MKAKGRFPLVVCHKTVYAVWLPLLTGLAVFFTTATAQPPGSTDTLISAARLKSMVYELADDSMEGRLANSMGCRKAAHIIARRMEETGLKKIKGFDGYFEHFDERYNKVSNVAGILPGTGKADEIILISAHYDHLGLGSNGTIFNGANDDASGVAVMLALAAHFATSSHQRTVLFVAFSGEESGFWGSRGFISEFNPQLIMAQINLEMLGRKGEYRKPFITGSWFSNLHTLLNQALKDTLHLSNYFQTDRRENQDLFQRSDNYPLALTGVPAHTIMLSTDADPYYHTVDDDPETLDYTTMCSIAGNIALAIEPIVQGQVTPNRINPHILPKRLPSFKR